MTDLVNRQASDLRAQVSASVARRIAYYNVAEYALDKVLEHFIVRDDPRYVLVLRAREALFEARDAEGQG